MVPGSRVMCVLTCLLAVSVSPAAAQSTLRERDRTGMHGMPADPPSPRSHKLEGFATGLYAPRGQAVLQVIGDSLNATNRAVSMQIGYRDQLEIPFNGWVVHADNGNADVGYMNAQGSLAVNLVRDPGEIFTNGLSGISPVRVREVVWAEDVSWGNSLSDCYIVNSHLNHMKLGNPFACITPVDVRLMMFESGNQLGGFEALGMRSTTGISAGMYARPDIVAGGIVWIDRFAGSGFSSPGVQLRSDAITAESKAGADTLMLLGARFRARTPDGVQIQFISHGGWTTIDHLDQARFTDEALRQYYAATDAPTHALLWLGQNQDGLEATALAAGNPGRYKANIKRVIARHEAVIATLGAPAPRWLLVSQYKTGYAQQTHELIALALYQISMELPNVSFLNLYRIAGGEDFNSDYLEDDIHPNAAGAAHLAGLMNAEMKSSIFCTADFDHSGFVDGDDFDSFVSAFGAGEPEADIDWSGFVDIDDLSTFIAAFELGC